MGESTIEASSKQGLNGQILIDSPNQVTGTVAVLDVPLLDISEILRERCAANVLRERSSFTIEGKGGIAPRPGTFLWSGYPHESASKKTPDTSEKDEAKPLESPSASASGKTSREKQ